MTEPLTVHVVGRPDLDGTHRAILETEEEIAPHTFYLLVTNGALSCGTIVIECRKGSEERLLLDRFKQRFLGLRDGDPAEVKPVEFQAAQFAEVISRNEFTPEDIARLIGKPFQKNERSALYSLSGEPRVFEIGMTSPGGILLIAPATEIKTKTFKSQKREYSDTAPLSYKDIGGLAREMLLIREIIEYPILFPNLFRHLGIPQPRGILLHGPPGTGKTLIARAIANEIGAHFFKISGPELYSKWLGKTEENLRNIFTEAMNNAPSVIVIDEIDALVPRRDRMHGEIEQRIVSTMLTQMDGLQDLTNVVVIGTTNRLNSIDPALRREGRFSHEIHIGVPDTRDRSEIFRIHTRQMPLSSDVDLQQIASKTSGFVGSDIRFLCREAAYRAIRRAFSDRKLSEIETSRIEGLTVSHIDFEEALKTVTPSAIREFTVDIPITRWEDIGGLTDTKQLLIDNVVNGFKNREYFSEHNIPLVRGVLLYGQPGTGKTLIGKAIAYECGAQFLPIKGPALRSRWFGESEEKIRDLFSKAKEAAPCIIFFDEIDAVAPSRLRNQNALTDSLVNQLLSEMDGLTTTRDVVVIGATNRPELLDPALLRPGRFDYQIEIPLPDLRGRESIFSIHLNQKDLAPDVDLDLLVRDTEGMSGADISEICREAMWEAAKVGGYKNEHLTITMQNLLRGLENVKKSLTRYKVELSYIG